MWKNLTVLLQRSSSCQQLCVMTEAMTSKTPYSGKRQFVSDTEEGCDGKKPKFQVFNQNLNEFLQFVGSCFCDILTLVIVKIYKKIYMVSDK